MRARIVELLFCSPWRLNEILNLAADCIRTEKAIENGKPVLDDSGQQIENFGIAYGGSKGYPDSVKWIPTAMAEVAKKALDDIIRITQPARDTAKWMAALILGALGYLSHGVWLTPTRRSCHAIFHRSSGCQTAPPAA